MHNLQVLTFKITGFEQCYLNIQSKILKNLVLNVFRLTPAKQTITSFYHYFIMYRQVHENIILELNLTTYYQTL